MKKAFSLFLALALCISALGVPVFAEPDDNATTAPYVNAITPSVELTINDDGLATIKSVCTGVYGTTSIRAVTYLERKINGTWLRVSIPEPNDHWASSSNSRFYSLTKTHQLTVGGSYRAVTVFVITAQTTETVTVTDEATF